MDKWKHYDRIRVCRWSDDGKSLKLLGERVCEIHEMRRKIALEILEDAGVQNRGRLIVMYGSTLKIFKNGISPHRDDLLYDADWNVAEYIHIPRLIALADAVRDFMGDSNGAE